MAIHSSEPSQNNLTKILDRLLSDVEFRQRFLADRPQTLMDLGLTTVEYSALLHLDVKQFVDSAKSIIAVLTMTQ